MLILFLVLIVCCGAFYVEWPIVVEWIKDKLK